MSKGTIRTVSALLAIALTARAGICFYGDHKETWYNLRMDRVVERADADLGVTDQYWVREDGCKMYGPWIIVAAHPSVPRYSFVDLSLGTGIVLDTQTTGNPNIYDIAVDWR